MGLEVSEQAFAVAKLNEAESGGGPEAFERPEAGNRDRMSNLPGSPPKLEAE
ncbi:MAG: hypothetical protein ACPLXA_10315 [Moorellaceae bacterium]